MEATVAEHLPEGSWQCKACLAHATTERLERRCDQAHVVCRNATHSQQVTAMSRCTHAKKGLRVTTARESMWNVTIVVVYIVSAERKLLKLCIYLDLFMRMCSLPLC